jgi:hypothetical protein
MTLRRGVMTVRPTIIMGKVTTGKVQAMAIQTLVIPAIGSRLMDMVILGISSLRMEALAINSGHIAQMMINLAQTQTNLS